MPRFKKKPLVIEAKRMDSPGVIESPQGPICWDKGDWHIKGVENEDYFIPHRRFVKLYDPDDDEARQYLERVVANEQIAVETD